MNSQHTSEYDRVVPVLLEEQFHFPLSYHGVAVDMDFLCLRIMLDPSSSDALAVQVSSFLKHLRHLVKDIRCSGKSRKAQRSLIYSAAEFHIRDGLGYRCKYSGSW